VDTYLISHHGKASEDSLFVVWIGANNYLGMPSDIEKTLIDVNTGITHSLQKLAEKGAKHILVLNLPDLGKTPAAVEFNSVETMSYFSNQHNAALDKTMATLKQTHPDVNWLYYDMNKMFTNVLENPKEYGFTNVTGTCSNALVDDETRTSVLKMVASVTPKGTEDVCDGYLFFDLVHPTALTHKIMAEKARKVLDELGVELVD